MAKEQREDDDDEQDPYGAIKFGEFRKYMQNKQSKLKNQQQELQQRASQARVQLFKGCSIYINGYTDPPTSDLRRMILEYGGDYQHYLKKISVTHIIATNLTNSKIQEFRTYKVVKPEWITESVEKGELQSWQNYRLVPRSSKQKELVFQTNAPSTDKNATDIVSNESTISATTASTTTPTTASTTTSTKASTTTPTASSTTTTATSSIFKSEWQKSVSTSNPEFIKRFYETSRLHHLSTWKSELREIIEKLQVKYPKASASIDSKKRKREIESRVVMHIDFDCFFASVGIKDRPHLKNKPVAVSHSKGASEGSSSDIASCNYVARSFGLKNGMPIGAAKRLCPELEVIPYEFEKYRAISETFYEIVYQYADEIKPVSVDEALIEVGSHITEQDRDQEEKLATKVRDEIRTATGCEVSIGIGPNILLARMSTTKAKPAGQYYCKTQQDIEAMLADTEVMELPGVGHAIRNKLREMNVLTVNDVRKLPLSELQSKLGTKMGQTLYQFSRGIDDRPLLTNQQRQSVSADVNWGMRFESEENEKEFVKGLSKEVSERLEKLGLKGKTITVKIMKKSDNAGEARKHLGHGIADAFSKSYTLSAFTRDPEIINKYAYSMLKSFNFSYLDMRGFGIQMTRLDNAQESTISPDQGVLNFKARPQHVDPIEDVAPVLSRVSESVAESSTRQKEEYIVDYSAYLALPSSVQQEITSHYNVKFTNADLEQPDSKAHVDGVPELPPWSQVDPEALSALPNTLRAEYLDAYENRVKAAAPVSPERKPKATNTRKSPATTPTNQRNRTITELFSPHRMQVQTEIMNELPYDVNVWNELPVDLRNEILADHRNKQKRVVAREDIVVQPQQQDKSRNEEIVQLNALLASREPTFQGLSDIDDIRTLLRNWTSHYPEHPEQEDTDTFYDYLVELVKISDLEKVKLLITYLDYITSKQWKPYTLVMKENISEVVISLYGYPLQF